MLAATPPLEAKKTLLSLWARMESVRLDSIDVGRARLRVKARRKAYLDYVDLPAEDVESGTHGVLKRAMCGTRDAAQNWQAE